NGVVTLILDQLDEKESTGPKAEIQRLIGYYRPKVDSLRQQRDSVESDPAIPSRDKMQLLATLDSRLTPMEELYLKLTASLTDPSSAGTIAIPGLSQLPNVSVNADAVQIMDWAELPTDPVSGGELRILAMAVFSALLVGVGLAFLMEYMDERVKTPRRLEQALGLAPMAVIGTIPSRGPRQGDQQFAGLYPSSNSMSNGSGNHASSRRLNAKLVAASNPLHPTAEDFRFARTMVLQRGSAAASQVLLVTSWGSGEGKSTTLANLAVTLAQGGQRVVVVDADLRRPTLHRLFDVSNEAGLSAVLAGEGNADRWLQSTPIDNLRILTAGLPKHSPADMLSSPLLAKVLEELKGYAQTVLIDAPALSVAADALQVARGVDGVLLVADSRKTTSSALTEAKVRLELVGANLRGVILTRFSEKRDKRYYRASAHKRALTPRLGEYLIKSNLLTADQLQEALKRQGEMASQGTRKRIGEVLVEEGYITSEALAEASRRQEDGV
ncbi:MAG: polysaccharide biosynthesis tyrosine autokinase, partial [Dehalococcoidia bacterium]|nr:polysaccharide biosynthesis tyrosine autokinase [Dehalococcoidia bacterium]